MSEVTRIPESTVRRYCQKFSEFMTYKELAKGKRYDPKTIEVLERISTLYDDGFETSEIKNFLSNEFAITIEQEGDTASQPPSTTHSTNTRIIKELTQFKEQQEAFNKNLINQLKKQEDYIKESIERRDRELMGALKEIQEQKKLANEDKKSWWKFWK